MEIRRIAALVMSVVLMFSASVCYASAKYQYLFDNAAGRVYLVTTDDGWKFMYFEGNNWMACQGYEGSGTQVKLPTEVDGHPVIIGNMNIPYGQIERYEIPDYFSEIDSNTFGDIYCLKEGCTIVIHNRNADISLSIGACKSMGFVLSGYSGSTTQAFANKNGLPFVEIGGKKTEAPYLKIDAGFDQGLRASAAGGRGMDVNVSANVNWAVKVTKGSEWITLNTSSGFGNGSFYTTITTNNESKVREGSIEITANGCKAIKIKVTQEASKLEKDAVLAYESLLDGGATIVASLGNLPIYVTEQADKDELFEVWYKLGDDGEALASDTIYVDNSKANKITLWCKSASTWAQPNENHRFRFEVRGERTVLDLGEYDYQGSIGQPGVVTVAVWDDSNNSIIGTVRIIVNGSKYDIVPISDYFHEATRHLILHDESVPILLLDCETGRYCSIDDDPGYKVKVVSYGDNTIKYKSGKVYCSKKKGAGIAQLQLLKNSTVVSTILVSSDTVIAPSECTGFTSIKALVETSNKRSFFGEEGFSISQDIELFDVECWEKHDKPEQYPHGYYVVAFDAYNSSVAAYGIKILNSDLSYQEGTVLIDGYTHTISYFKAMADLGATLRDDFDDKKIGTLTGETETFRQKTEVVIEVPMGGLIQFVQMSDDNDTFALNVLNYILAMAETNASLANVLVPGTDAVTAIDAHKVLDKLSESAKDEMCKAMVKSIKLGDPESIKNIIMGEGSVGWSKQVQEAIKASLAEGAMTTTEDILLLAGASKVFFVLNGADFINKGLTLSWYTTIILQEMLTEDHILVDAVYFPNATNPTMV